MALIEKTHFFDFVFYLVEVWTLKIRSFVATWNEEKNHGVALLTSLQERGLTWAKKSNQCLYTASSYNRGDPVYL